MFDLDESDAELETSQFEPELETVESLDSAKLHQDMDEVDEISDEGPEPEADFPPSPGLTRDDFEEVLEPDDEPEVEADTARTQDFEEVEEDNNEPEEI